MQTLSPIVSCRGRYLYCGPDRFIVKGIVYQPRERSHGAVADPLSDSRIVQVTRDIELLEDLGVNVIWVYRIDSRVRHDACMNALAAAGIYVIASLFDGDSKHVINRIRPRESYTQGTQDSFNAIVDCMARYDNTLGVSISNDLISDHTSIAARADVIIETLGLAIADLKAHMDAASEQHNQRRLPICMADTSWALRNTRSFEYLTNSTVEGRPPTGRLDFYGINHYDTRLSEDEMPTATQHQHLPWNRIHTLSKLNDPDNPIPIILSEYSGVQLRNEPRTFQETADLYRHRSATSPSAPTLSSPTTPPSAAAAAAAGELRTTNTSNEAIMSDVLSGGCMYEFFNGANGYGIVKVDDNNNLIKIQPQYDSFREQLRTVTRRTE